MLAQSSTNIGPILDSCTSLSQGWERNVKVEDFVGLCVAVWETSGAMSDRVHWVPRM